MDKGLAVGLTAAAGGLLALQAPVNSTLGKATGTFAASSISFAVGTVLLVTIAFAVGGYETGEIRTLPWWAFTGGLMGAFVVTTVLVSVRSIGAGGVAAATIGGQLAASIVADRLGILGLPERPITVARTVGVVLLAVGVFLIVRE